MIEAERPLAFALGDIHPTYRVDMVQIEVAELSAEPSSFFWCRHYHLIDTWRVLSLIHLGDATNAFDYIRLTPQHQALQRPDPLHITCS